MSFTVSAADGDAEVVAVLGLLCRVERGEERAEIGLPVEADEIGCHVEESEHVGPPALAQPVRGRLEFDVETGGALDVGDEVRQWLVEPAAQRRKLAAQPAQAGERLGRERRQPRECGIVELPRARRTATRPRPRRRRASAASAPARRAPDAGHARARPPGARARRDHAEPMRQRGPVSSRTIAAFAVASCSTRRTATRSATSGASSRPPRPIDLHRHPAPLQAPGAAGRTGCAAGTAPRPHASLGSLRRRSALGARRALLTRPCDVIGDPVGFADRIGQQGRPHLARVAAAGLAAGPRLEHRWAAPGPRRTP